MYKASLKFTPDEYDDVAIIISEMLLAMDVRIDEHEVYEFVHMVLDEYGGTITTEDVAGFALIARGTKAKLLSKLDH